SRVVLGRPAVDGDRRIQDAGILRVSFFLDGGGIYADRLDGGARLFRQQGPVQVSAQIVAAAADGDDFAVFRVNDRRSGVQAGMGLEERIVFQRVFQGFLGGGNQTGVDFVSAAGQLLFVHAVAFGRFVDDHVHVGGVLVVLFVFGEILPVDSQSLFLVLFIFRFAEESRAEEHTSELQSRENLVC